MKRFHVLKIKLLLLKKDLTNSIGCLRNFSIGNEKIKLDDKSDSRSITNENQNCMFRKRFKNPDSGTILLFLKASTAILLQDLEPILTEKIRNEIKNSLLLSSEKKNFRMDFKKNESKKLEKQMRKNFENKQQKTQNVCSRNVVLDTIINKLRLHYLKWYENV